MTPFERDMAFLDEYISLCRKYGLTVNSCGCCGSPWVTDSSDGNPSITEMIDEHKKHLRKMINMAVILERGLHQ